MQTLHNLLLLKLSTNIIGNVFYIFSNYYIILINFFIFLRIL